MGRRFRDLIQGGPLARSGLGDKVLFGAGIPGLVAWGATRLLNRGYDRADRRVNTPYAPSPDMAAQYQDEPQALMTGLGMTNWRGATPPGQYGPMADAYAGLPAQPDPGPETSYDPDFTERLVQGYQNQPLMSAGYGPRTGNISQGGTRGFGVQSTTDIGGILDQLNFGGGNIGGQSGNYFDWLARNRPPVER